MGSDVFEEDAPTRPLDIKVHRSMCTQLLGLVDRISSIIPNIEAAQPIGLHALSELYVTIEKARELVQNCRVSSKLYLAITGETIKSRFEKVKKLMEQNLSQLQNMVPVALKLEMSEILIVLRSKKFSMDSCEELAGKTLRAILQLDVSPVDSVGNSEIELLQFAVSMLHLTSPKDLLIERRCLKKLLNDVKEEGSTKRKTIKYLFHLLRKYDSKLILQGQTRNLSTQQDAAYISVKPDSESISTQSAGFSSCSGHAGFPRSPDPPEGFKCPLSSMLMYDPVIISSGQTYERVYIQKWFDDGHVMCPKTRMKLSDLSIKSNTPMRELILKWSMENGLQISDPSIVTSAYGSPETSSNSFCSTASSMKDINLQIDTSNLSLGSLDSSYSYMSHSRFENSFGSIKKSSDVESHRFQLYSVDEIRKQFLSNVRELPWELQCTAIQDVNTYLMDYNPSCSFVSPENFLDPLILFLEDALDKHDKEAQKAGSKLFLTFLQAKRREPTHLNEDVYSLLASFLATEAAAETLAIMEVLSTQVEISKFAASGALSSILKIINSRKRDLQESALNLLHSLSAYIDSSSCKLASDWVPILVPFLEDSSVAGTCLRILERLCQFEETRVSIAETQGCIASIIKLLEDWSCKDQEHAVRILLDLCSQREYYCQKVLHEDCIPALHNVSVKGSDKGKAIASELLRQLRETRVEEEEQECPPRPNLDVSEGHHHVGNSDQKSPKPSGFMRRLFKKK